MDIRERVGGLFDRKNVDHKYVSYVLCKTFGWDYYTLSTQPIPFVLDMLDEMRKETKKMNKNKEKTKGLGKKWK
jgi:hypothetical protein